MAGKGRPKGSPNKDKPFRDALRMEAIALANGEIIEHPKGSLRWNAQRLLMLGEVPAIKEIADRLDGRVPQAITGEDGGPIRISTLNDDELDKLEQLLILAQQRSDAGDDTSGEDAPAVTIPDNGR